jgi:hypothetical protein
MAVGDLTSLANVKAWAGVTSTNDDALLARLITSASRFVINYLDRGALIRTTYNEPRKGTGNPEMVLRQYPVIQINSLTIRNCAIAAQVSPPFGAGYVIEPWNGQDTSGPQKIFSAAQLFPRDYLPTVVINYDAGFFITEEQTIPAGGPFTLTTMKIWAADYAITYTETGAPLVQVANDPAQGQYTSSGGTYTFNAADASANVNIAYSYTPADIEQAVIELVGERYNAKSHIGYVSKSLGGQESVSFSQKNMNDFITSLLEPFQRVVPI